MKTARLILALLLVVSIHSCKEKTSRSNSYNNDSDSYYYDEDEEAYPDDTYCADVEYYNPNTGTRSTYTLNVEVEDNEVTVIYWPNGGWLDDDHFYPEELDSDGYCYFTSDKGYEYTVQITGSACSFTDSSRMRYDLEDDREALTCPNCGGEKYAYDEYCEDCQDRIDKTCSRCGQYDPFMWSGDELCSDCQADDDSEDEDSDW